MVYNICMKTQKIILIFFSFLFLANVNALALSLGAGGEYEYSPYKNESYNFFPLPIIKYDSRYLYFNTPFAGAHILKKEGLELNLQAEYTTLGFKADNHTSNMRFLKDRDSAVTAGLESVIWGDYGIVKLNLASDVSGNSGLQGKASYGLAKTAGIVTVMPQVGLQWYSARHNRYFFGVSEEESSRSGFEAFSPSASAAPFISLAGLVNINERTSVILMSEYGLMPSQIKDSPITDKNKNLMFYLSFAYKL